jgi:hypothetical protein
VRIKTDFQDKNQVLKLLFAVFLITVPIELFFITVYSLMFNLGHLITRTLSELPMVFPLQRKREQRGSIFKLEKTSYTCIWCQDFVTLSWT